MALQRISEVIGFLHSPPHRGLMVRSAILWGLGDAAAQAMVHYSAQVRRFRRRRRPKRFFSPSVVHVTAVQVARRHSARVFVYSTPIYSLYFWLLWGTGRE